MPLDTPAALTPDTPLPHWPWTRGLGTLGSAFAAEVKPRGLPDPYMVASSSSAAQLLSVDAETLAHEPWLGLLSGNRLADGAHPLASVYSGHQFGVWAGQLGDGRALLLGESNGWEIQLKGSGLTPFSRMGDGRAVLRSSIREFLCSEAMHALGIPTTRALCVIGSDAPVYRELPETAAVVTRLAPSFLRFGHFEHFCHHDQHGELKVLADYTVDQFYPQCRDDARWGGNAYAALLYEVCQRTAELMAQWQAVGFCHGVMNTDNMSILGLTIDYGPFQFLDGFDPGHICNHSDHQGRYAFARQPSIAFWNLMCLGQALLPLIDDQEHARVALETYKAAYPAALARRLHEKLGFSPDAADSWPMAESLLRLLTQERVDHTIFWRTLSRWSVGKGARDHSVRDLFMDRSAAEAWLEGFRTAVIQAGTGHSSARMLAVNPKFVLRNHMAQEAIDAAQRKDFSVVRRLHHVLNTPYDEHAGSDAWAGFPPDWAAGIQVSCSS